MGRHAENGLEHTASNNEYLRHRMAKTAKPQRILLRWSEHVPASDVQDPLGLGLRGSTRLASRLLFCITSVTPRARYFSFIPWCILDYQKREKGKSFSTGLRDAIVFRERALTLSCIAYHEGQTCEGGGVVGSDKASKWFAKEEPMADFTKKPLDFAKNPALGIYINSLVNLGCFVTDEEREDVDDEMQADFTFDDILLSPLGQRLAEGYDSMVGMLPSVESLAQVRRRCSVEDLTAWGERGGLCEVSSADAKDRQSLRDMFLAQIDMKGESHPVRKQSLLLILELVRQLSSRGLPLKEPHFSTAVYFNAILNADDTPEAIEWPDALRDIVTRWRMFYFHHFMSVALEGMLSWLITNLADKGVAGATIAELLSGLNTRTVSNQLGELLHVEIPAGFGSMTPADFVGLFDVVADDLTDESSVVIDEELGLDSRLAEPYLEHAIREQTNKHSVAGLAIPTILLSLTLARYSRWKKTDYGNWLANTASDEYLDLIPPIVLDGLTRRFDDWWNSPFSDIAQVILSRFVVQQHQSMSYEKSTAGNRCLLQVDGANISVTGTYDRVGMGNPRLRSAIQILKDLAFLADNEDGMTVVTEDGTTILEAEISTGGVA